MRHTEKECKGIHCRCMQENCTNQHHDDHVQLNGLTPKEERQQTEKKNRPICPECLKATIVLFTPPREGIVGTEEGYRTIGTPEYIDWKRAHLYCCNGETNCKYTAYLMDDNKLTTP